MPFKMKGFTPFRQVEQKTNVNVTNPFLDEPEEKPILDQDPVVEENFELPHTAEKFRESYELPEGFKVNKFKDKFQFGEKGLWGSKYQTKKQDKVDSYRTEDSVRKSDFRDWDKKDDARDKEEIEKNIKTISLKDYKWREKDKEKKKYYPHHEGSKWDKNYVTIGTSEGGLRNRVMYRVTKEDLANNRYYQNAYENYKIKKKMSGEDYKRKQRQLPYYLDPAYYNWNE